MDSLTNLASSLPTANFANAEKDLMNNFKAAALSITTLYKSSLRTSKRAYNSGYVAACQDLLVMIQQGVSAGESSDINGNGMTIGRIMDYIEARLEAIKSREEEEEEDEERDREKERRSPLGAHPKVTSNLASTSKPSGLAGISSKSKDLMPSVPMTPLSPIPSLSPSLLTQSTSPSPSTNLRFTQSAPSLSFQRNAKSRLLTLSGANVKDAIIAPTTSLPPAMFSSPSQTSVAIIPPSSTSDAPFPTAPTPVESAGTKRRHAMMAAESPVSSTSISASTSRRRTRSSRSSALSSSADQNQAQTDAMDVEDEGGRERKRVARR